MASERKIERAMRRYVVSEFAIWMAVAVNAVTAGLWLHYYADLRGYVGLLHGG